MLDFARLLLMPAQALGEELFDGDGTRAWLYGSAMHSDVPPARARKRDRRRLAESARSRRGLAQPRGRRRTARRRARLLPAGAGRTPCAPARRVTRFAVERGRVVGVELAGGERLAAPVVVADVMPVALASLAGEALPPRYARALRRYRYGPATLKIDWALDGQIPWSAPQAREAGTVHVGGSAPEMLRATIGRRRTARASVPAARPAVDRRPLARAGGQAHRLGVHARSALRGLGSERERHVARMEAQVERFAPGFRERILARHVLGPADLRAAQRQSRRRRCRRGQLLAGPGRSSVPCRRWPRTARPCGASTWAARRPSRAAPCTAFRATRPPGWRSPRRASAGSRWRVQREGLRRRERRAAASLTAAAGIVHTGTAARRPRSRARRRGPGPRAGSACVRGWSRR